MPIEQLKRIVVENHKDGTQIIRLPNNQEMMDKINEIILFVNMLEKNKQSKPIQGFGLRKTY